MKKILYHLHIMWYEVDMIPETLDSLMNSISNANNAIVDIRLGFNYQTYLESPETGDVVSLFSEIKKHKIFSSSTKVEVIEIKNTDPFYNVADWRRDNYGEEYDYYVWGESDCLVPNCFFFNVSNVNYTVPHVVSYSNRKMWDSSWLSVEHEVVKPIPYTHDMELISPLAQHYYMSEEQMNNFNSIFPVILVQIPREYTKIDGNMMAISKGLPTPILPYDLHFIHDDLALEIYLKKKNIPQLHFPYQLKAHNRMHPLKRKYTKNKKEEETYMFHKDHCMKVIEKLANSPI